MKYGILGDIHGNLEAFEAVISAFQKENVTEHICVGDIVGYGADPNLCIEKLLELNPKFTVAGNHDYAAVDKMGPEFFNSFAKIAILWTKKQLTRKGISFLKKLKLVERTDLFTVVHGTLAEPEKFFYIQTPDDAKLSLGKLRTPVCFFGHSHVPISFLQNVNTLFSFDEKIPLKNYQKALINVGSVGQPRDENPKACYVIYDSEEGTIDIKRVGYDTEKAGQKIISAGLPSILAERITFGR